MSKETVMLLNTEDTANFMLLHEKYTELRALVLEIHDMYFRDTLALGKLETVDPTEKQRLHYCSRAIEDMDLPLTKTLHIIENTLGPKE
jgi:hypothetical protein